MSAWSGAGGGAARRVHPNPGFCIMESEEEPPVAFTRTQVFASYFPPGPTMPSIPSGTKLN